MSNIIYLVRHGEFEKYESILPGRLKGFKLSVNGVNQIKKVAKFIASQNPKIDYIYSSKILRTRQTAKIIGQQLNQPEIIFSNYILEVKSSFDGLSREELKKTNFDFYSKSFRKPGDETIEMIEKRMRKFLKIIYKKHPGKNIVAVTHADPMMIIKASILNMPLNLNSIREPKKDYVKFGEVFKIEINSSENIKLKRIFSPI